MNKTDETPAASCIQGVVYMGYQTGIWAGVLAAGFLFNVTSSVGFAAPPGSHSTHAGGDRAPEEVPERASFVRARLEMDVYAAAPAEPGGNLDALKSAASEVAALEDALYGKDATFHTREVARGKVEKALRRWEEVARPYRKSFFGNAGGDPATLKKEGGFRLQKAAALYLSVVNNSRAKRMAAEGMPIELSDRETVAAARAGLLYLRHKYQYADTGGAKPQLKMIAHYIETLSGTERSPKPSLALLEQAENTLGARANPIALLEMSANRSKDTRLALEIDRLARLPGGIPKGAIETARIDTVFSNSVGRRRDGAARDEDFSYDARKRDLQLDRVIIKAHRVWALLPQGARDELGHFAAMDRFIEDPEKWMTQYEKTQERAGTPWRPGPRGNEENLDELFRRF